MWSRTTDDRDWRAADFVALDFETTEVDPRRAAPLSVGWIVVRDGRVRMATAGYHVIDHAGHVPVASMRVHGLLPDDVAAGLPVAVVAARLRAVLTDRVVVVAHGAWIEQALLLRMDVERRPLVDTLAAVRRIDEREGHVRGSVTLSAVARRFGVPPLRAHHAFGDALTTALLLITIAGRLERERGRCLVDDLVRLGRL